MKRVSFGGFTIVESMVVLGVTGVLFISLAAMVSGQQSKARFKAAMTDITTQIQTQINEVSTGYYPTNGDFKCSASGSAPNVVSAPADSVAQGTNADCTFLGRAMMYGIPATDPQEYKIQTLVGLRRPPLLGREPSTIQEAGTRVLERGFNYSNSMNWPNLSTTKTLQYGTEVVYMRRASGGPQRVVGIAIVAAPNQQVAFDQNGSVESGTVIPSIIPIPYSGAAAGEGGVGEAEGVDLITRTLGLPPNNPQALTASASDGPIDICFRSGTTNQSGLVTIGRNNSTTSIELNIFNTLDCT